MSYDFKLTELSFTNFLKFIFFLTFIDFILFSTHRILISFNVIDSYVYNPAVSNFTWANYVFLFCVFLFVFFYTFLISIFVPKKTFKINLKKKTFFLLIFFLFISSLFLFFEQQNYKIRYTPGSITTFAGILAVINGTLLLCSFIIYQINRKELNLNIFFLIIISSILSLDGLAKGLTIFSMIFIEFYRLSNKKKIYFIILSTILLPIVLYMSFFYKYAYSTDNFVLLEKFSGSLEYIYEFGIPRASVHGEQLYSYVSGDLSISNYNYLFNVINETFFNRFKVIFNDGNNLFYPKTVGQSISFDMFGSNAKGGSSPGYVLSAISFFPFTLPLIFLLVSIFKEISLKFNERVNLIQVACFCYIFKGISANLLDMLGFIDIGLFMLCLVYISCHVKLKNFKKKDYLNI
tara:strand:- start:14556 stop:15773 length:1218 start_codon:yes stop_codon:yes gene_type:complete